MANKNSLLFGLVVGGVIGSIATLLSTPSSGKELRGQLNLNRKQLEDLLHQLKNESKALKEQLIKTVKDGSVVMKEVSSDFKKTVEQFQQEIGPHKNDLMKEIEEIDMKIKKLEQTLK
ncbi:YtxH domain-containing protein [Metabacillus sp. YM-086]|uniref:YtxH domain-containing protein n=1 Tax=Metabacillus sp. YM-086 TaxID=3341729 RepID=UPI003A8991B8